jgi:hypothetical protein
VTRAVFSGGGRQDGGTIRPEPFGDSLGNRRGRNLPVEPRIPLAEEKRRRRWRGTNAERKPQSRRDLVLRLRLNQRHTPLTLAANRHNPTSQPLRVTVFVDVGNSTTPVCGRAQLSPEKMNGR